MRSQRAHHRADKPFLLELPKERSYRRARAFSRAPALTPVRDHAPTDPTALAPVLLAPTRMVRAASPWLVLQMKRGLRWCSSVGWMSRFRFCPTVQAPP